MLTLGCRGACRPLQLAPAVAARLHSLCPADVGTAEWNARMRYGSRCAHMCLVSAWMSPVTAPNKNKLLSCCHFIHYQLRSHSLLTPHVTCTGACGVPQSLPCSLTAPGCARVLAINAVPTPVLPIMIITVLRSAAAPIWVVGSGKTAMDTVLQLAALGPAMASRFRTCRHRHLLHSFWVCTIWVSAAKRLL